jgi:propionyl-CoA carboxylase beta chain
MATPTPHDAKFAELAARHAIAEEGGGPERRAREHKAGKLSARERIDLLLDEGTFEETDKFVTHRATDFGMDAQRVPGDGFITGHGRIHGRVVFVFAQDFTVFGGSLSEANAAKIVKIMDMAMRVGAPIVGLNDSGGARIQEGVVSLAGYTDIFLRNTLASGVVPQISAILGPCAGGAVYSPGHHGLHPDDRQNQLHVRHRPRRHQDRDPRGRDQRRARRRNHTQRDLRRRPLHGAGRSPECLAMVRELLSFLPSNNLDDPPRRASTDDTSRADASPRHHHPRRIEPALRHGRRHHPHRRRRLPLPGPRALRPQPRRRLRAHGWPPGRHRRQPADAYLAGVLDIDASVKGARFVRFCDAFNIPLITFEDVPGFMPGVQQEHGGIIRHGAKLLYAFAEATVPKLTVITRKAYGGAYCVMSSKHLRTDLNLAWPTAEIAVMGPEGAVNIVYRREFDAALKTAQAVWPQGKPFTEEEKLAILADLRAEKVDEFSARFANPYVAAERGYIDAVIRPSETRRRLNTALDMLATKRDKNPAKKHGNIPL